MGGWDAEALNGQGVGGEVPDLQPSGSWRAGVEGAEQRGEKEGSTRKERSDQLL